MSQRFGAVQGLFPNLQYPRVPGHEIVAWWMRWAPECRSGASAAGRGRLGWRALPALRALSEGRPGGLPKPLVPGVTYDGGYAEYVVFPAEAVVAVPESLKSAEAAPLLCAGIMTFNALRNAGAKPPDTVAVLGMGGLGRPLIETYPLDRASEAYDRMMRGKARFRVVLQMS